MGKATKKVNKVTIDESLFNDIIIQIGILQKIYDEIKINTQMKAFQKRVLLKNKETNVIILNKLEKICDKL